MARPLRIQFENAHYHVTCRGNARQDTFDNERDYAAFLDLLARSSEIYQVAILVYVLMRNHFHLLLRTPLGNLQEFMRHFSISYTSYFNRAHRRSGHLFQGRYKSFLIDADTYLLVASRYVHLNPLRVRDLKDLTLSEKRRYLGLYPWSSYIGYIKENKQTPLVHYDILEAFGSDTAASRMSYRRFVEAGLNDELENPFETSKVHGIIGDDRFLLQVKRLVSEPRAREVPAIRHLAKIDVETIVAAVERQTGNLRNEFFDKGFRGLARPLVMESLYRYGGVNQQEIGKLLGIDYSTVSVARKRLRMLMEKDSTIRETFGAIELRLKEREKSAEGAHPASSAQSEDIA